MALLVGLYLLWERGDWSGVGLITAPFVAFGVLLSPTCLAWIAAAYGVPRAALSLSPHYRTKRRELAVWREWPKTCAALNWLPMDNRDNDGVPDPELVAVDMSGAEGDAPVEVIDFRPRPDVRAPKLQYPEWANQLGLFRGAHGTDHKVIFDGQGGPIVRARLALSDISRPAPLTTIPEAPFGEFPLMKDRTGQILSWCPVESETPVALFSGQPGTGKTSLLRIPATVPFQWDEPVEVVFCSPKPADFDFLREQPWSERGTIVAGVKATRDYIKELRKEVDARNKALDSPAARSTFVRPDGVSIRRQPTKIHELSDAQRVALKLTFKVVIIDELATILVLKRQDPSTVLDDFRHIVATMRSAGLILVLGMHRPDAAILGGFTRDLIRVRVLQGMPMKQALRMLFEELHDATWDLRDDFSAGTVLALGLGNPPGARVVEGKALYLDPDYLHPTLGEDGQEVPVTIPNGEVLPVGESSLGLSVRGDAERSWEDRARWWLRTGWATARLAVGRRVQVPVRDLEFRGTLLKTKALACAACGTGGYLEADHICPFWAGGVDDPHTNGQLLCKECHARKTAWEVPARAVATGLPRAAMLTGSVLLFAAWLAAGTPLPA